MTEGGELFAWSTLAGSLNTSWDLVLGNYLYSELAPAAQSSLQSLVLAVYFYSYIFLMLLLLSKERRALDPATPRRVVTRRLHDGYTTVTRRWRDS